MTLTADDRGHAMMLTAAEERSRIARDLHDSAGHVLSVILVQAAAARLLQEKEPERSRQALETIEQVARDALGEIDQLVRALRANGSSPGAEPPPGLAELPRLVERQQAAGLAVSVTVGGSRRALPAGADQGAYRIVQEALTNAARYGRGRAELELAFGAAALEITVTNAIAREPAVRSGGGHGIVGMHERAQLLGGSLETDRSEDRFRIRARLPYGRVEA